MAHGGAHRLPSGRDVHCVASNHALAQPPLDDRGGGRVGVGVAKAADAAGLELDNDQRRRVPLQRPVGLGRVGRNGERRDRQPLDRNLGAAGGRRHAYSRPCRNSSS